MTIDELSESSATLDAMATAAATSYYDMSVKYGVAKYPRTSFRKSRNWPRFVQIARICMHHKIPVESFVTSAFLRVMDRHPLVTVNDICSFNPDNISTSDSGGKTSSSSPSDLWNMLSCKLLDMVFSLDGIDDKSELLDNAMYGFPAWFRVFSPDLPNENIIVHWGDLAFEEMSDNPKLNEYLKKKRPATYKLLKSVISKI